jgi:hypothetical protein
MEVTFDCPSNDDTSTSSIWKFDAGATDHCTPIREYFTTYSPSDAKLMTASGEQLAILGTGSIHFTNPNGCIVELRDVLHCPALKSNLFAGAAAHANGVKIMLEDEIILSKDNQVIQKGYYKHKSWFLKLNIQQIPQEANSVALDATLNHRKWGHMLSHKPAYPDSHCPTCAISKSISLKWNYAKEKRTPRDGLYHFDLSGPYFGIYIAVCIWDGSDETAIFPLNQKTAIGFYNQFLPLLLFWQNQYSHALKAVKTDGGSEFINNVLLTYFSEHGVAIEQTNPGAHQQNPVIERRIRTIYEIADSLLLDSGLQKEEYLIDAFETAVYLLNRRVSALTGRITFEHRTGKIFDPSYLRVFGSKAYLHVYREKRRKSDMANKAIIGILVNYSENGYVIELPDGKRVHSREVKFDETKKMKKIIYQIYQ